MIGIVITTIMMVIVYTSYSVVNQSYSQVSEKAKISRASRDIVSMLMRDVRMAGFKYYAGSHEILNTHRIRLPMVGWVALPKIVIFIMIMDLWAV